MSLKDWSRSMLPQHNWKSGTCLLFRIINWLCIHAQTFDGKTRHTTFTLHTKKLVLKWWSLSKKSLVQVGKREEKKEKKGQQNIQRKYVCTHHAKIVIFGIVYTTVCPPASLSVKRRNKQMNIVKYIVKETACPVTQYVRMRSTTIYVC